MNQKKLLAIRFTVFLALIIGTLAFINYTDFIESSNRTNLSLIALALIIGSGTFTTYRAIITEPEQEIPKPTLEPNGGVPVPNYLLTQEEIEDELRRIAREPEVIVPEKKEPEKQLAPTNQQDGKEVIREKIIEALRTSTIKVKVGGTMDGDGNVDLTKFQFLIKSSGIPTSNKTVNPVPEKPQKKLSNEGRRT